MAKTDTKTDTNLSLNFLLREGKKGATIICSLHALGKLRISTGLAVPPALWDEKKQRCKGTLPIAQRINSSLADYEKKITDTLAEGQALGEDKEKLKDRVLKVFGKGVEDKELFLPFFFRWLNEGTANKLNYNKQDLYTYHRLSELLPKDLTFEDIDYNFYTSLLKILRENGLKENTIGLYLRKIKAVMNEAYKRGLHTNVSYHNFKVVKEEVDAVYLTAEELKRLSELKLRGTLAKTRDLFLLGCYTAMRFSDYKRITPDWIKGDNLVFIEEKTGNRNVIPLSKKARSIIEKYGGAPVLCANSTNKYIKDVCKLAGINDKVEITYTRGGKEYKETKEKWQMITTHTARRTGATLLIKAGAPVAFVMSVTGHKSEKVFMHYVRLSREEYADLARSWIDKI